ncbi:valyl-tRNA synthetase [Oscillochloris trichoides DG-6]|uniref:Valine--tRNA ligase n=1 Tax=Oscillochloris trichoides DG-6 TaxID=765420 RepID=E1IEN8_9CHLR|nr:valine--tRNA ligase [Oscillochloris trichoides]EFO80330.1 valyl-tRNA synthetase [Oscillochloris trichoides DG-6]
MTNAATPPIRPDEMAKAYEHQPVERPLYTWWEQSGFFAPRPDAPKPPFVISIPPPNVTGELHLGHAMFVTIEDLMIRWRRMQGYQTLWVPGTDHAGIATQTLVEKLLRSEGTSREQVGREEFLRRTWEWKAKYGGEIQNQLRRLGASCDWERERFTLDEGLSRSVQTAFKRLYDDGLIYKGTYLVNWSPNLQTAVSDLEVEFETRQVSIWHVRYPVINADWAGPQHPWGSGRWAEGATQWITVATTRPETILGDTAVATPPGDPRFSDLLGRSAVLPALARHIPIIADEYVDPEFGSGAVKITPAHDKNDYEVGKRHNLPQINILNKDATINAEGGPYQGMERFAARKAIVQDLEREGLLVKVDPHTMSVGISQRSGEIIEPLLSEQWFVKTRPLADLALAAVREGRTKIIPERFEKVYYHWMENIEDWCISRQLWWGHRIPVWYMPDGTMLVLGPDETPPEGAVQDPDVLDTWFSSGLWPFSTLGWPEQTPDLATYYPTSVMETGYDIIFFWVARMMMLGCYLTGTEPFHTIYLHGLVRDEHGRKMSKSYGNVVNPLEVMDAQGTDALRYTLATSGTPGQDLNLNPQRIEAARNFANKIWNITRFVISKGVRSSDANNPLTMLSLADRWILSRYHRLCLDSDRLLEGYNFGEAGRQMHDFLWGEFADWYVEIAKVQLEGSAEQQATTRAVLYTVLEGTLRLLHPYIPFITEEVWQYLTRVEGQEAAASHSIMLAAYPSGDAALLNPQAETDWDLVQTLIVAIRNIRSEYKVEPAKWVAATVVGGERVTMLREQAALIARLGRVDLQRLEIVESIAAKPTQSAAIVLGGVEAYLPLAGLIDLEAERVRLRKELEQAEADVARREAKLDNPSFVGKAPANVVQRERDSLETARAALASLRERLAEI